MFHVKHHKEEKDMRLVLVLFVLCLLIVSTGFGGGSIHCWGTGSGPPEGCAYPDSLFFGQVDLGQFVENWFIIKNIAPIGSRNLEGWVLRGPLCDPDYTLQDSLLYYSLAPGDSVVFTVRFTPQQIGDRTCDIGWGTP